MERQRHLYPVAGVAAVVLAISVIVPALRPSPAQDAANGPTLPPALQGPQFAFAPLRLAQLPAVEPAAPAPAPLPAPQFQPAIPSTTPPTMAPAAPAPTAAAPAPAPTAAQIVADDRLQLRTLSAEQLHTRLEQIFGRPAPILAADGSAWMRFTVQTGADAPVLIAAQPQTGEVRLVGRPDQLKAWREIITAIDAPAGPNRQTEVVAADEATAPRVRRTVNMMLAQAQVPAADGTLQGGIPNLPAGLLGPVEIVNVEGTDLFIIQGAPRDVARAMEIIRQIQEMSSVSEPQLVVRPLKYVGSEAISSLLGQLFGADAGTTSKLGSYYGSILALPLGKPNAVLLVGSGSTIEKVQEILDKLDTPGEPSTQFEVFRLKHADATLSQAVVEKLFTNTPTEGAPATGPLRPLALVIAEARTNALIVRASPSDMEDVRRLVNQIDQPGGEAVNELRVFKLKYSLATALAPVLQTAVKGGATTATEGASSAAGGSLATLLKMVTIDAAGQQKLESGVLAGVQVNADPRANALVVSAPPESMPLMAALIAQLDQPPDAIALLKVFTIKNGDAVSLAQMLQDLFGAPQTGGGGGGGGGGFGGGGGGGGAPAANANGQVFQLRFSVDERTNSIIAAGSEDELLVVESILLRLDAGESRSRLNKVYRLKNASAQDVAFALTNWLQQKRDIEQTAPGVTSPFAQLEREVVVVAEIASNSLIVSATPTYYKELEGIIEQLDEQAPMVMIQVLIGEVRLGDADEFGVELGLQDSALFDRSVLANIANITNTSQLTTQNGVTTVTQQVVQTADLTPGFNFGDPGLGLPNSGSDRSLATAGVVGAQGLSNFAVNRVSPDLGFGGLVLSATSNSVSMLLRALQETRRLEVLSRPQIMTLDNQPGRCFVGQIVPIITGSSLTNFGVSNQVIQQPVGLELIVTPRISPDDLVVMTVSAFKRELSPVDQGVPVAVSATGDPVLAPIINSTEAQTTVSAVTGQTVILSGLLTKRDEALHRRVPLLADIPLVGQLFRYDSSRQVRTELLIILTPHVVRSRVETEKLNRTESSRMSWCLSDVVDLHGPAGLRSRTDPLGAAEAEAIYPNATPAEVSPLGPALDGDMIPSPADGVRLTPPEPTNWPPQPTPPTPTLPQGNR